MLKKFRFQFKKTKPYTLLRKKYKLKVFFIWNLKFLDSVTILVNSHLFHPLKASRNSPFLLNKHLNVSALSVKNKNNFLSVNVYGANFYLLCGF